MDPTIIFGLQPGETAAIRNVGGRIFPSTLQTMGMLRMVTKEKGAEMGTGWNLIILHHTDCGIKCLAHHPDLLARHFGVPAENLEALAITDPYQSVALDEAALKANPQLPGGFLISGLVYDVQTGKVEVVVPSTLLRPENPAP